MLLATVLPFFPLEEDDDEILSCLRFTFFGLLPAFRNVVSSESDSVINVVYEEC